MSLFAQYVATAEALGFPQPAGAADSAVAGASAAFMRLFETSMPADYADFLRACDGFDADGARFYGLLDAWDDDGAFLPGLFDSNERLIHGAESIDTPLRFVGESGHELYAHDTADGTWKRVDRISWAADGPGHASFTALFTDVYAHLT